MHNHHGDHPVVPWPQWGCSSLNLTSADMSVKRICIKWRECSYHYQLHDHVNDHGGCENAHDHHENGHHHHSDQKECGQNDAVLPSFLGVMSSEHFSQLTSWNEKSFMNINKSRDKSSHSLDDHHWSHERHLDSSWYQSWEPQQKSLHNDTRFLRFSDHRSKIWRNTQ